jgi:hypothetical protein
LLQKRQKCLITKLNTPQCPVTILQCYIREAKIDLSTDKYIFRPLIYFKRNKNYMMRNSNIKLSYTRAREIIREALSSIGINMNNYGLHSLRSGGASAAYKCDNATCQTDSLRSTVDGSQKMRKTYTSVKI